MLYIKSNELNTYLKQYKRNWWLFALSLCGCLAVAALFILVKNKKFEVYASIYVNGGGGSSSLMASMAKSSGFGDILGMGGTEVDNEIAIMESHHIAYHAVKASNYNVSYSSRPFIKRRNYWKESPISLTAVSPTYSDTLQEGLTWKIKLSADGTKADVRCKSFDHGTVCDLSGVALPADLKTGWGDFQLCTTESFKPGKAETFEVRWYSYTAVAQSLMRDMKIQLADKKADIIQLCHKDAIPARCQNLLNCFVDAYEEYSLQAKDDAVRLSMDFLQHRIDTVCSQLAELEAKIESYKLSHKLSDVEVQAALSIEKEAELEKQITELEIIIGNISELERYLDDESHRLDPLPIVSTGSGDATEAIMAYNSSLNQYLELRQTASATNPTYKTAERQIAGSREALKLTIKTTKQNAQAGLRKLNSQNHQLLSMVNNYPKMEREFIEMKREQELKQKIYVTLLAQQEQNALNMSMDQPKSQVVDEAYANVLPSGPKASVLLIIALFLALFLPAAWLKFLDLLCPTVQSPEQVKALEGFHGDIHTLLDNDTKDLQQLALQLKSMAKEKDIQLTLISMQGEPETCTLANDLRNALSALGTGNHVVTISEAPAFTQEITAMYQLEDADVALLVVRKGVTRKENLTYIETLLEKGLMNTMLTAYLWTD